MLAALQLQTFRMVSETRSLLPCARRGDVAFLFVVVCHADRLNHKPSGMVFFLLLRHNAKQAQTVGRNTSTRRGTFTSGTARLVKASGRSPSAWSEPEWQP
jgi:hypothetical protein